MIQVWFLCFWCIFHWLLFPVSTSAIDWKDLSVKWSFLCWVWCQTVLIIFIIRSCCTYVPSVAVFFASLSDVRFLWEIFCKGWFHEVDFNDWNPVLNRHGTNLAISVCFVTRCWKSTRDRQVSMWYQQCRHTWNMPYAIPTVVTFPPLPQLKLVLLAKLVCVFLIANN